MKLPTSDYRGELEMDLLKEELKRREQEIRMENRKFLIQTLLAAAALLATGVAIGRFIMFHA